MSLYKPTQDEIEKYSGELSDLLSRKTKESIPKIIEDKIYDYNKLIIEPELLKEEVIILDKKYMVHKHRTHDISLKEIKSRGYLDHLSVKTYTQLVMDYYENKLPEDYTPIVNNILSERGQWCSEIIEFNSNHIIIYKNNDGLTYDLKLNSFVPPNDDLTYRPEIEMKIKTNTKKGIIINNSWIDLIDLNEFNPDIVEYFFNRPFNKIPKEVSQKFSFVWTTKFGIIEGLHFDSNTHMNSLHISAYSSRCCSRGYKLK